MARANLGTGGPATSRALRKRWAEVHLHTLERTKRRGARLGIAIAILAVLPGLVAGTSYIDSTTHGSLTGTSNNAATGGCGWTQTPNTDSEITATTAPASGTGPGATATFSFNALGTGGTAGTGYEYLVDEFLFGCTSIPAGTTTIVLQICGASDPTATAIVAGGSSCAGGSAEGIIDADWMAQDVSTVAPVISNPVTGAHACGTNDGTDQAVATLYSQTGTTSNDIYYSNTPTLAASTAPTGATADFTAGTDPTCLPAANTVIQTTSGAHTGTVTLTALAVSGSCTAAGAHTCGETLTYTDVCTVANAPCGTAATPDNVAWYGFAMVDQNANGLESCINSAGACTLGSNAWTGQTAFVTAFAMN